jgi:hypothetical protein
MIAKRSRRPSMAARTNPTRPKTLRPRSWAPPSTKMPKELTAAIRLYDQRVADDPGKIGRSFNRLGTPALEEDLSPVSECGIEERLILVGEIENAPVPLEIDFEHEGQPVKMIIPAYHMVTVSNLRRLTELMTHPQVGDPSLWRTTTSR